MTDPAVLKLAREVVASLEGDPTWKHATMRGERDHVKVMTVAIAAIEATNERMAFFLESGITHAQDGSKYGWDSEMRSYADGFAENIRAHHHLRSER